MKSHWTIGKKLTIAFICVVGITVFLGSVGYYGAITSEHSLEEIGSVRMPGIEYLLTIKNSAERIRGTIRTLLIAGLPIDIRQRQANNLSLAQHEAESAWKIVEQLPKAKDEVEIWNQFSSAWKAWQQENYKLSGLFKEFDRNGITRSH